MIDFSKVITAEDKLRDLADKKLAAIRAARKAVEDGGMLFEPLGVVFDSDERARAKYSETGRVFGLMPDLEIEGWKASDGPDGQGIYVTMTKALLDALTLAGAQHDTACFAWERARQAEVAAAVEARDVEALEAVSTVWG